MLFGIRPGSAGTTARSSIVLLAVALLATLTVVVFGSVVVWNLYESAYAGAKPSGADTTALAAKPLRVGVARTPGGPSEWITFAKVLAQLQRDLNRPVTVRYALSSEDQVRLIERQEIDVVLMSTLGYLDAQAAGLVVIVAAPVVLNEHSDPAVIVVRAGSDVKRLEDLRGRRFALADDLAGVSYTHWLLEERGVNPVGFFSETTLDVQDANLTKVANGDADGTSVRRSSLATWPKGVFRIVEQSPGMGLRPIVARESLDDSVVADVRRSLLDAVALGVVPEGSVITGFRTASDAEYDFARVLDAVDRDLALAAMEGPHK